MQNMAAESIDLIYIDPPFGTQSLWQSKAFNQAVQELKFYDIWGEGINGYLSFLTERLKHMHRLLKPTGSLFVHLDWRMSHYIKIELDKIFGITNPVANNTNFINEIIWCYKSGGASKKHWSRKHDTILFYVKNKKKYLEKFNIQRNEKSYMGKNYQTGNKNVRLYKDNKECCLGPHTLVYPKDWWDDCGMISTASKNSLDKRTGWPTQKPVKLLKKIIEATTKPKDIVVDFFSGCGTTINAAQSLNRQWMGIDASKTACEVMRDKMSYHHFLSLNINSIPISYESFKNLSPTEFEKTAIMYIGGVTQQIKKRDSKISGRLAFDGTPIQVKKENKLLDESDHINFFYKQCKKQGRGIYITLNNFTKKTKERIKEWSFKEDLDIQFLTIKNILAGQFREQPLPNKKIAA